MKRVLLSIIIIGLGMAWFTPVKAQQPADGENSFYLSAVNNRFLAEGDTVLGCSAGRGIFATGAPDLDQDGKPEILVTEYSYGGRVHVFEVVGNNTLEYVWSSKKLRPTYRDEDQGPTPRAITVADWDNNGKMEIIFQSGYLASDSLDFALRGIYIYEHTGKDNDYGTEPVRVVNYAEIDTLFNNASEGRGEESLFVGDIDGDGKNEMLFPSRNFTFFETANMYIVEVESGTFAGGDDKLRVEYVYKDMATALSNIGDGYTPTNAIVGNVDADENLEIVVAGWTIIGKGAALGFIEIGGPDTYTPGSIVPISTEASLFTIKSSIQLVGTEAGNGILIPGGWDNDNHLYAIDNIISDAFVSDADVHPIYDGIRFGALAVGDQDHGPGADGFDIYYSDGNEIRTLEYNGSGALSDPASYSDLGRLGAFSMDEAYTFSDGLFNDVFTFPGMDLDGDGNREVIASYKGSCGGTGEPDSLQGERFIHNTFNVFVFEWGDSTQSIELTLTTNINDRNPNQWTIITPEDYTLEQNYPNPFNPETTIRFSLPLDKRISLKIYNTLGEEVRTLINDEAYARGAHAITWDARDDAGRPVPSGTYIYKLIFGNFSKSKTMTLVR